MCPIPQLRLVGVKTSYVFFFLVFPGHLEFWTPLQIPIWAPLPPLAAPWYSFKGVRCDEVTEAMTTV